MSFLRIKVIFLALYCHSPTFAVNDIAKFVNTCFTFISYHIWTRHLQFRCTKAVRRYLKRPPFFEGATVFWGGHRWPGGPPVAPDGKRHPYIYIYIYIYIYMYVCIWVRSRNCGCLVTGFCYQLIAKPGNKTATVSWSDSYIIPRDPWNVGRYHVFARKTYMQIAAL